MVKAKSKKDIDNIKELIEIPKDAEYNNN